MQNLLFFILKRLEVKNLKEENNRRMIHTSSKEKKKEKRKNVRQSFLSLSLLCSYALIIDHHLLFHFDHAISLRKKKK